jgi:hypothetical protein
MEKILNQVLKNKWINGMVDYADGDLFALCNSEEIYNGVKKCRTAKQLFQYLNNFDGIFTYGNLVFANSWKYGTFVYVFLPTELKEFEHLTIDAFKFDEFRKWLREANKIQTKEDIKKYFGD